MQRLVRGHVGVTQGSRILFSDFTDDGPMWVGEGAREHRSDVTFDERYATIPAVHLSVSMWDCDNQQNQRMDLSAENISETGFQIVFRTWGDSRVARLRASWLVIGALPDEDSWDL